MTNYQWDVPIPPKPKPKPPEPTSLQKISDMHDEAMFREFGE